MHSSALIKQVQIHLLNKAILNFRCGSLSKLCQSKLQGGFQKNLLFKICYDDKPYICIYEYYI